MTVPANHRVGFAAAVVAGSPGGTKLLDNAAHEAWDHLNDETPPGFSRRSD